MGQNYQDLLNKVIVMKNNSAYMALLSLDGQSPVDYSLPVRILNLETFAYAICFDKGIRKPIITLVINWRMEPWDGPVDLYSMMRDPDPDIRAVSRNYTLNLLDPMTISDDAICRYQSELMPVLASMKYSRNKSYLEAFTEKHSDRFQHLSQFAVNIITQAADGTSGCQIC